MCDKVATNSARLAKLTNDLKLTFPSNNPRKRIDYLFISSDCNIISKEVLLVEGPDHLPEYAVIDI